MACPTLCRPADRSLDHPPRRLDSVARWVMAKMTDPDALGSQARDAILFTIRGGLRIFGGVVEVAAGVTSLMIDMTVKAIEAAESAVEAADVEDDDAAAPKAKPKSQ